MSRKDNSHFMIMKSQSSLAGIFKKLHRDQQGAVSFETILIIAAIALPILIFLLRVGWPRIKALWTKGMSDIEGAQNSATTQ
jgi:hypothetical protein